MNLKILTPEIQSFIINNIFTEIPKLILKGSPFEKVTVQELANQILAKQKSKNKLPTWFKTPNIYYPAKISIEQTSSEITAKYKSKIIDGEKIIDITGGFGIDCYYFSKNFKKVIHCEINSELSEIVAHNYNKLDVKNIKTIPNDGILYLKNTTDNFDCIYVDPSRRNDIKGKVFLLKDCLPNIPEHLEFLFSKTKNILIKNSPLLDISSTIKELNYVKEIHIVAIQNEVKELLFLLQKGFNSPIKIKTINITPKNTQRFNFIFNSNVTSKYSKPLHFLYEPNGAILKSGGFHNVSNQLDVYKLHQHSHLYTSEKNIDFPGRCFEIIKTISYNKKEIKKHISDQKANITIRNFPKTVAQIRKETKLKDGGNWYLFFTKNIENKNIVILCKKPLSL